MRLHQFLTRLFWLCILPLVILSAYLAMDHLRALEIQQNLEASHLGRNVAATIDRRIGSQIAALQRLADSELIDDPARWPELYQQAQGVRLSFDSHLILADLDGQMRFNTRLPYGAPLPKLPQVQGHAAAPTAIASGKPAVSDQFLGPVAQQQLVAIAVPVLRQGQVRQVLLSVVEIRQFQQRLDELALPKGWSIALLDGRNETLARHSSVDDSPTAGQFIVKSTVSPWSVVVTVPQGLTAKPQASAALALLIMILGAALTGVLAGRFASRRLEQALKSLTQSPLPAIVQPEIAEIEAVRRRLSQMALEEEAARSTQRASEQRFQTLFNVAPVPLCFLSNGAHVLNFNLRFEQLFGYSNEDLPTIEHWWRLAYPDPDYRQRVQETWSRVVDRASSCDGDIQGIEYQVTCKNGEQRTVLISGITLGEDMLTTFFDMTERRQAEEALKSSMQALQEAQRLAGIGNWSWDVQRNVHYWSEEVYRIYGRDPALPPASYPEVQAYFTAESWIALSAAVDKALKEGRAYACDAEVVHADGSRRWVMARGEAEQDATGTVIKMHGTVQDITDRKLADQALHQSQERALEAQRQARLAALNLMEDAMAARGRAEEANAAMRQSEQRLLMAQEGAHVGIWDWDVASDQTYWSPECERLYGVAPGGLRSNDEWRARILPEDLPRIDAIWNGGLKEDGAFEVEYRLRQDSGEIRWLVSKGQAQYDASGRITRMSGINLDITELKQHRQQLEQLVAQRTAELQQTNNKLLDTQFAMERLGIGIHWVDVASGRLIHVNRFAAQMLGYSVEEMLSMVIPDIDPNVSAAGYPQLAQSLCAKGHAQFETQQKTKTGQLLPVELNLYHLPAKGDTAARFIVFVTEISKRKEAALALVQAKEAAEAATRAKSAFLANMSHEIRTPMNAIIGLTHLLQRAQPTPQQSERLDKIVAAAGHLLAIINDILDLSKIEAGRLELERTDFPMSAVLDQVRSLVAEQAAAKGLTVEVDYGQESPPWLRGDPTRLRQALLNFAGNAIKFTEQGKICLRARILTEDDDELLVRFEVQDEGIGIAADKLPKLFRAFEQADASTTRKYGGTGLGLAVTQRLAGLMGGQAGADSTAGVGSTFWFTARLGRGNRVGSPSRSSENPNKPSQDQAEALLRSLYAGAHLLLAEDDPINQEVALSLLAESGLRVDLADDGRDAVAKASSQAYDLILMDMQMPHMDGLEATRRIRALEQHANTPILAMTANAFEEDRRRCMESGMNDFIAKPVDPQFMFDTLLKWLSLRSSDASAAQAAIISAPPDPDAFARRQLARIPGLDIDLGLRNSRGKVQNYVRRLRLFADSHGQDMAQLQELQAHGAAEDARRLIHTLKGTSGLLGLVAMQKTATSLEAAMKTDLPGQDELVNALCRQQADLASGLDSIPIIPTETLDANPEKSRQCLEELLTLLDSGEFKASRVFQDHLPLLRASLPAASLTSLERAMNAYDFPAALIAIRQTLAPAHGSTP